MRTRAAGWFRLLAVTALMGAGCGQVNPPATGSVTSPSPTSPVATPGPTPAPILSLALVTLRGSNSVVVRDITDINHPKTMSNLGALQGPQFVSGTALSYVDANGNIVLVPVAGSPKTIVAKSAQVMLLTWSPDESTAAYISNLSTKSELHFVTGGQNRVVSSMPAFVGGCETQSCADGSDFRLSYSQDGDFIALVQPWGGPNFRMWSSDGKLLNSNDPGSSYRMSTWSGNGLYLVGPDGVAVFRNAVVSSFLPGVSWIRPKGSPAGGQIVYEARDGNSLAHVYLVNTTTRQIRELKKDRAEPVFLTSRYIWYKGERACVPADNCDPNFPVIASGKTYIYDMQDGTETESVITSVADVWPHAA